MKKITAIILCVCLMISCTSVFAKSGDIVTYSKYTNIAAYINHFAIQSYNINGTTCVGAEDLGNFGFLVEWDPLSRSLRITRNYVVNDIEQYSVPYETNPSLLGQDDSPVYETDIKTYVNGVKAVSYNIGGKTVVDFDSLSAFGKVEWNPDIRAIKLWVEDGLEMNSYMQPLTELPQHQTWRRIQGYWFHYNDPYTLSTNIQFNSDGTFYMKTWRTKGYGTYTVTDENTIIANYDSYFFGAGSTQYYYDDSCSTTYKLTDYGLVEINSTSLYGYTYSSNDYYEHRQSFTYIEGQI